MILEHFEISRSLFYNLAITHWMPPLRIQSAPNVLDKCQLNGNAKYLSVPFPLLNYEIQSTVHCGPNLWNHMWHMHLLKAKLNLYCFRSVYGPKFDTLLLKWESYKCLVIFHSRLQTNCDNLEWNFNVILQPITVELYVCFIQCIWY